MGKKEKNLYAKSSNDNDETENDCSLIQIKKKTNALTKKIPNASDETRQVQTCYLNISTIFNIFSLFHLFFLFVWSLLLKLRVERLAPMMFIPPNVLSLTSSKLYLC